MGHSCWCLLFVCRMLRVMLAPFLLCFVCFQLTDFFHHLLLRLQHLNEDIDIVSRDSWLWLGFSPHYVYTFRLVRLLLVRRCWPKFCLRGHGAHVSRRPRSWGHLFARASVPIYFQLPNGVANLNVVGLFMMLGWAASRCTGPKCSG